MQERQVSLEMGSNQLPIHSSEKKKQEYQLGWKGHQKDFKGPPHLTLVPGRTVILQGSLAKALECCFSHRHPIAGKLDVDTSTFTCLLLEA